MEPLDRPAGSGGPRGFLATANGADVQSLGLLQRILLVSDGTLTDVVEAAFQEPIRLVKLGQDVTPARAPIEELEVEAGDLIMRRQILLQGGVSARNYVFAESVIVLHALPPKLRDELVSTDQPLGRLWVEHRLETRKEILKVWRELSQAACAHFADAGPAGLLARSYRVFSGQRPIMLISEHFPAA